MLRRVLATFSFSTHYLILWVGIMHFTSRAVPVGAKDPIVGAEYAESQSPRCELQFPLARLILIGRLD